MAESEDTLMERALAVVPGWLFLLAGLTMVAAAVLTPSWLASQKLAWQHALMEAQAQALQKQARRYDQFNEALKRHDPVLLERLAYVQLRMKPANARLVLPEQADRWGGSIPGGGERATSDPEPGMLPIASWLHQPLPTVGQEVAPYRPPDSRLTRLATGQSRFLLLAAGLLCGIGGLLMGRSSDAER
jgi:hypothetical protein